MKTWTTFLMIKITILLTRILDQGTKGKEVRKSSLFVNHHQSARDGQNHLKSSNRHMCEIPRDT